MTNKELVEKYPWLAAERKWIDDGSDLGYYKISDDYEYEYTVLDEMPDGWRKAFGMELVEEIDKKLKEQDEQIRKSYYVYEIKEKMGELRWYDNGDNNIQKIIKKYSCISRNVCMVCGKPDVRIRTDGWIWPECKECYEKEKNHTKPYESVVNMKDDGKIADSYSVIIWSKKGDKKITYDISETVEKVRRRWKENFV